MITIDPAVLERFLEAAESEHFNRFPGPPNPEFEATARLVRERLR